MTDSLLRPYPKPDDPNWREWWRSVEWAVTHRNPRLLSHLMQEWREESPAWRERAEIGAP